MGEDQLWLSTTVHAILTRTMYKGSLAYKKTRGKGQKRTDKSEWIYGDVPAIVSKETFELAQQRLKSRKILALKNRKFEYLLSGLVRCLECSRSFHGWSDGYKTRRYGYYQCNGRRIWPKEERCETQSIRTEVLDSVV